MCCRRVLASEGWAGPKRVPRVLRGALRRQSVGTARGLHTLHPSTLGEDVRVSLRVCAGHMCCASPACLRLASTAGAGARVLHSFKTH